MADLNKISSQLNNLKDLDAAQLSKIMGEYKNPIIMSALIVGSLLIAGAMFNNCHAKSQALSMQISQGNEKTQALKDRDAAKQELIDFKSSIPKKFNVSQLITVISQYAKLDDITISSLSPAESKDMGLYDALNISVTGEADSFKSMVLFLRKIEKSNLPLRINSWNGQLEEKGKIKFDIEVGAVLIHL